MLSLGPSSKQRLLYIVMWIQPIYPVWCTSTQTHVIKLYLDRGFGAKPVLQRGDDKTQQDATEQDKRHKFKSQKSLEEGNKYISSGSHVIILTYKNPSILLTDKQLWSCKKPSFDGLPSNVIGANIGGTTSFWNLFHLSWSHLSEAVRGSMGQHSS